MLTRSLVVPLLLLVASAHAGLVFTSNSVGTYGACAASPLMNASSTRNFIPTDVCVQTPSSLSVALTPLGLSSMQYVKFQCNGGEIQMRTFIDSQCITPWSSQSATVTIKAITADTMCNALSFSVSGSLNQTEVNAQLASLAVYGNCASSIASPAMGVLRAAGTQSFTCANESMVERFFRKTSSSYWYPQRPSCSSDSTGLSAYVDASFSCEIVTLPGSAKRKSWSLVYSGCGAQSPMGTDNSIPSVPALLDSCIMGPQSQGFSYYVYPACDMGQSISGAASLSVMVCAAVAAVAALVNVLTVIV